jgi:hypothetical protein
MGPVSRYPPERARRGVPEVPRGEPPALVEILSNAVTAAGDSVDDAAMLLIRTAPDHRIVQAGHRLRSAPLGRPARQLPSQPREA